MINGIIHLDMQGRRVKPSYQRFRINDAQFKLLLTFYRFGVVRFSHVQEFVDSFGKTSWEIDMHYK